MTEGRGVACYVRVSTAGQNEEGQRREIERWLRRNGIEKESVRERTMRVPLGPRLVSLETESRGRRLDPTQIVA